MLQSFVLQTEQNMTWAGQTQISCLNGLHDKHDDVDDEAHDVGPVQSRRMTHCCHNTSFSWTANSIFILSGVRKTNFWLCTGLSHSRNHSCFMFEKSFSIATFYWDGLCKHARIVMMTITDCFCWLTQLAKYRTL